METTTDNNYTALSPGQFSDSAPLLSNTTQNQNVNGSSYPLPTDLNTMDVTKVGEAPITTPAVPPPTSGAGLSTYVSTAADSIKAEMDKVNAGLQADISSEKNTENSLGGSLKDIYSTIAGIPAESNAIYAANGVDKAQKNVNDINTLINSEKVATDERIKQLRDNAGGGLVAGVNAEINRVQNDSSYRLANYGIALSAASGNWSAAQAISDRQIKAITDPLQTALDSTKFFYQQNHDTLTKKEDQLYTNKINELTTSLKVTTDAAVSLQSAKTEAMKTAQTQGATSDQILKIQNAKTYDELGTAVGQQVNPSGTGAGTAAVNVASKLGIQDTTQPLVNVIAQVGIDNFVTQMMSNEGGSPAGVKNNPGNIKYQGLPGQTDSGVKAKDGGTFASYATSQAGKDAIKAIILNAANGGSSAYGKNVTFQDFVNKYTNTTPAGITYNQYGKLANTDFNPTLQKDKNANAYLTYYLKNGVIPTPYQLGISTRVGAGQASYSNVQDRANQLFYQATGTSLPVPDVQKGNIGLVNANNKLINNLAVQEATIKKNFGLNLENLNGKNINQSVPILNGIFNAIDTALGVPGTAQYNLQNATLQQEAGNLMAVKNATGTTVYDKMVGAGLIPRNASAEVQAQLMKTLLQEALNAKNSINEVNSNLYSQIDPLEQDPNNPNRQSSGGSGAGGASTYKGITLPN